VAVVFLGAFAGLNLCGPEFEFVGSEGVAHQKAWGWPCAIALRCRSLDVPSGMVRQVSFEELDTGEWIPWTHQTYNITAADSFRWLRSKEWTLITWQQDDGIFCIFVLDTILDVLFFLSVFTLILFLQIPRRKVAAKVEPT